MNVEIKQIINTIWKWKILIISILGVTVVGLVGLVLTAEDTYTAWVELQITPPESESVAIFNNLRATSEREAVTIARNNFEVVVESDMVYEKTVNDLGLSQSEDDYAIEVKPKLDADFVSVSFSATSPELAASIANTHIQNAIERLGELRALPAQERLDELAAELDEAENALREIELALSTFESENNLSSSLENEIATYEQRLQNLILSRSDLLISQPLTLNNEVTQIDTLIGDLETEREPLEALRHRHEQLLNEQTAAQAVYKELLQSYAGELSPYIAFLPEPVLAAKQRLDEAETAMATFLVENDMPSVESELALVNRQIQELKLERDRRVVLSSEDLQNARVLTVDTLIEETEARLATLTVLESQYNLLQIQRQRATDDYEFILQKFNETRIVTTAASSADFIQIITLATPPEEASSSLTFLIVFGIAGSLGLGIFLVFFLEYILGATKLETSAATLVDAAFDDFDVDEINEERALDEERELNKKRELEPSYALPLSLQQLSQGE